MAAYYNEFDPQCAAWLRELIKQGHISYGDVDERDMREVDPDEIKGYTQHHFFAGIGGWSLALRLSGWSDDRPVLTGSPPCQPFSSAGQGKGYGDERHLAPAWLELVSALRPSFVFGEQVAAAVKKDNWLDDLLNALEAEGYATGAVVLPACGVGSPHIRQRLWVAARLADSDSSRQQRQGEVGRPSDPASQRDREVNRVEHVDRGDWVDDSGGSEQPSANEAGWDNPDWLYCRDAKWRPVESGTFPLADGIPARVGRLRGYGNAIVPQVAAEIIKTVMLED